MLTPKTLSTTLFGAVLGISLVLACGDDGHDIDAARADDAATCDCPAAEPPITGRIMVRTSTVDIAANDVASNLAACNSGEEMLGGGCESLTALDDMTLVSSARDDAGSWKCTWRNANPVAQPTTAQAFCLVP